MMIFLTCFLSVFITDFLCKQKIESRSAIYWRGFRIFGFAPFDLVKNKGLMMGFLNKKPRAAKTVPLFMLIILCVFLFLYREVFSSSLSFQIASGLLLGGGFCNTVERIRKGYVTDYIHLPIKPIRRITFNLSDFGIFAGVLLMLGSV